MEETLIFITMSVNGGLVCLIKASIMIGAFALVLMEFIQASKSLIFWVVDFSLCLGTWLV